jgi:hypothetical protein
MVYRIVWCGAPPCCAADHTAPSFCPNAKLRNRNLKQPPIAAPLPDRRAPLAGSSDDPAAGASNGGCLGPDPTLTLRQRAAAQQPAGAVLPLLRTTTRMRRPSVTPYRTLESVPQRRTTSNSSKPSGHVAGFRLPRSLRCTSPNIRLLGDCAPPTASVGARVA